MPPTPPAFMSPLFFLVLAARPTKCPSSLTSSSSSSFTFSSPNVPLLAYFVESDADCLPASRGDDEHHDKDTPLLLLVPLPLLLLMLLILCVVTGKGNGDAFTWTFLSDAVESPGLVESARDIRGWGMGRGEWSLDDCNDLRGDLTGGPLGKVLLEDEADETVDSIDDDDDLRDEPADDGLLFIDEHMRGVTLLWVDGNFLRRVNSKDSRS